MKFLIGEIVLAKTDRGWGWLSAEIIEIEVNHYKTFWKREPKVATHYRVKYVYAFDIYVDWVTDIIKKTS